MKSFLLDIIPKIQKYSEKLDNLTLLTNQHWVIIDNIESNKGVYIFRTNGELLISMNGKVTKGKWEFLGNNTLLVDHSDESYLFKHGFFDENILALKIDGLNEYTLLVNETQFNGELNSIENIIAFLQNMYLRPETQAYLKGSASFLSNRSLVDLSESDYKILHENVGWSFTTGKYIEYLIAFDNANGTVLYDSNKDMYSFATSKKEAYFHDFKECIYHCRNYLMTKG